TEMPRARMAPAEIALVAAFVKSLGSLPRENVPGDAANGARLYATKGNCSQCHTLGGHGRAIGPDLAEIGRKRSAAYLRRRLADAGLRRRPHTGRARRHGGIPRLTARCAATEGNPGKNSGGTRMSTDQGGTACPQAVFRHRPRRKSRRLGDNPFHLGRLLLG